jgi:hypothetical protein
MSRLNLQIDHPKEGDWRSGSYTEWEGDIFRIISWSAFDGEDFSGTLSVWKIGDDEIFLTDLYKRERAFGWRDIPKDKRKKLLPDSHRRKAGAVGRACFGGNQFHHLRI